MPEEVEMEDITAVDDGSIDWNQFRRNFTSLGDAVNDHAKEITAMARRVTNTISFAIESEGETIIINPGMHPRMKVTNAFVQLGDNISDFEDEIEILGVTDSVRFSKTEKAGKIKIFGIRKSDVKFYEQVVVKTSSRRHIVVHITSESMEEL